MALLGKKIGTTIQRRQDWQTVQAAAPAPLQAHHISGKECRAHPYAALALRTYILLKTYRNDYHTDVFDLDRLAEGIRKEEERIFFWGDPEAVAIGRRFLTTNHRTVPDAMPEIQLGTATILNTSLPEENSIAELTRTGSISQQIPSVHSNIEELESLFRTSGYQVIFSTPRNRTSTPEIRGGAAIQRQHVRALNSAFWGWAPWYIMQGGFLEILDYRELYREPENIAQQLRVLPGLFVHHKTEAKFIADLFALNLGFSPPVSNTAEGETTGHLQKGWRIGNVASADLMAFNPVFLCEDETGEKGTFEKAITHLERMPGACHLVELNVCDSKNIRFQKILQQRAFYLVCVRVHVAKNKKIKLIGAWAKQKKTTPVAPPYYLNMQGFSEVENRLLGYLRNLMKVFRPKATCSETNPQ